MDSLAINTLVINLRSFAEPEARPFQISILFIVIECHVIQAHLDLTGVPGRLEPRWGIDTSADGREYAWIRGTAADTQTVWSAHGIESMA